jgi:DNA helicase HerA-like ATPase
MPRRALGARMAASERGGAMQRVAVIAKLKDGAAERARELVREGPPFDPDKLGFERHVVYVSDDEIVFVFEGARVGALVRTLAAADGDVKNAFAAWEKLLDGLPRLGHEAFFWERAPAAGSAQWGE